MSKLLMVMWSILIGLATYLSLSAFFAYQNNQNLIKCSEVVDVVIDKVYDSIDDVDLEKKASQKTDAILYCIKHFSKE